MLKFIAGTSFIYGVKALLTPSLPQDRHSSDRTHELGAMDSIWLLLDFKPTNSLTINATLVFDCELKTEDIVKVIEKRLLILPRFRMKAVIPDHILLNPYWVSCPVDLDYHIIRQRLPDGIDPELAFTTFVAEKNLEGLDRNRPLWRLFILDNYKSGSILLFKIHHCIGDGVGLLQVLLSLTDPEPTGPKPQLLKTHSAKQISSSSSYSSSTKTIFFRLFYYLQTIIAFPFKCLLAFFKLALLQADTKTALVGELTPKKNVAWTRLIPLSEFRSVAKSLNVTINDVAVAVSTGALRRYFEQTNNPIPIDAQVNSVIPFNLHPITGNNDGSSQVDLKNDFSLLYLRLPLEESNPTKRVKLISERMTGIKNSAEPLVNLWTMQLFTRILPIEIMRPLFEFFSHKASIIMTNVPGPQTPLYFAAKKIDSVFAWVPQSGSVGCGISIISYNQSIRIGFISDANIIPDPETVVKLVNDDLEELRSLYDPTSKSYNDKKLVNSNPISSRL